MLREWNRRLSFWSRVLCLATLLKLGDCSGEHSNTDSPGYESGSEAGYFDKWFSHGQKGCAGKWQQCGGSTHWYSIFTGGYAGNTTCCDDFVCNTTAGTWGYGYWKQCVPKNSTFSEDKWGSKYLPHGIKPDGYMPVETIAADWSVTAPMFALATLFLMVLLLAQGRWHSSAQEDLGAGHEPLLSVS
mmetsp:Transcript_80988/g.142819  ORF Transcript_80988/g.142819 Transcript_80988/m.142819 type:complete len:187 (+) Transcript_80988:54-614(+)